MTTFLSPACGRDIPRNYAGVVPPMRSNSDLSTPVIHRVDGVSRNYSTGLSTGQIVKETFEAID